LIFTPRIFWKVLFFTLSFVKIQIKAIFQIFFVPCDTGLPFARLW
jgi:hypothetical protein